MGAMFGVAVGAACAARADARNAQRLCEAIHASAGLVALIGLGQHLHLSPLPIPSISVPGSTFGNRNVAAEAVTMAIPFGFGLLGFGETTAPATSRRRMMALFLLLEISYLAAARARGAWLGGALGIASLLRAPPPSSVARGGRRPGRGRDRGRGRGGDSRPLDRPRLARRQTVPAGHARGPGRRRSELAGRAHPPGALAADAGALPFAAAGGDRRGQLPRAFSSLRRAERHRGRRAVADGRPAARPQRSAGAAGRNRAPRSGGPAGALRRVGRRRDSPGARGAARRPPGRRRQGRCLRPAAWRRSWAAA